MPDKIPAWERRAARNAKRIEELKRKRAKLEQPKRKLGKPLEFVYFVRCEEFVKIGWATAIETRMNNIRINNPYPIELLAMMVGSSEEERTLHAFFRDDRERGEWFRFSQAMKDFVEAIGQLDPIDARVAAGEWFVRNAGSRSLQMCQRDIRKMQNMEITVANIDGRGLIVLPSVTDSLDGP
jgi:hypothetical protein